MAHDDYKEMLAASALTALDRNDADAIQQHLTTCDPCGVELDDWRDTSAALALLVDPIEPPADLRDRLLRMVRADRDASEVIAATEARPATRGNIVQMPTRPRSWSSIQPIAAIAAVFVFAALLIGLAFLWKANKAAQSELARLVDEAQQTNHELTRQRAVLDILQSPEARVSQLSGTKDSPTAHGVIAIDRKSGRAVLLAQGLPRAPAGKAYQLWFIGNGSPIPGRLFRIDAAGNGVLEDRVPATATNAKVFAVTLEPEAGAPAPTGTMYLLTPSS